MYLVTIIENKTFEDLVIHNKLFSKRENALEYLVNSYLNYLEIYANDEEDIQGNFNCAGLSFSIDDEEIEYVSEDDERITDGWIDNVNCSITLQLREIICDEIF